MMMMMMMMMIHRFKMLIKTTRVHTTAVKAESLSCSKCVPRKRIT